MPRTKIMADISGLKTTILESRMDLSLYLSDLLDNEAGVTTLFDPEPKKYPCLMIDLGNKPMRHGIMKVNMFIYEWSETKQSV